MPPPRPHGTVKDLSKDRVDSKKNVTQQKAKLAEDWAKKNLHILDDGESFFGRKEKDLNGLVALTEKFKDDEEKRKKIASVTKEIVKQGSEQIKKLVKFETAMKTSTEVKVIAPMPRALPPTATDAAAVLLWVMLWQAWIKKVRAAIKK